MDRLIELSGITGQLHNAAQRAWLVLSRLGDQGQRKPAANWTWSLQGPAMVEDARRFLEQHIVEEPCPGGVVTIGMMR